ncbi:MAG: hypothetical protein PVJ84_08650 [Desulfobacteraceae bacterium]|jgi:hypothetical protein
MFSKIRSIQVRAYDDDAYPPFPTRMTLFWRRNLLWQAWRFSILNLKMMRIVVLGHD